MGYRIFQSIRLTFASPRFNMFESGLVKIKAKTFDSRKDRFLYRNITSKLDGKEVIYYFLANILAGNTYPLNNFESEGMQNYKDFIRRTESLSYIFKEELSDAALDMNYPEEMYYTLNDNPPLVVSYALGGILSLETICLIHLCCHNILELPYEDYIWNQKKEFIKTYLTFFENGYIIYDDNKLKQIYNKIIGT